MREREQLNLQDMHGHSTDTWESGVAYGGGKGMRLFLEYKDVLYEMITGTGGMNDCDAYNIHHVCKDCTSGGEMARTCTSMKNVHGIGGGFWHLKEVRDE